MLLNAQQSWEFGLLALCTWREARGEPYRGKLAVAWSIRNRVFHPSWWGKTYPEVILKPFQYSSFNHNDPNAVQMPLHDDTSFSECLAVCEDAYSGIGSDPTNDATHYHTASLTGDSLPEWARTATFKVQIGNHLFYVAQ